MSVDLRYYKCFLRQLLNYKMIILVGRPGSGKTTFALNAVAAALTDKARVAQEEWEALRQEATKRMFMGRTVEDVAEFLLSVVQNGSVHDYVIIDDAALGLADIESDPVAWAKLMDVFKVARNAVAAKAIFFTTTSRRFLSKRLLESAHVYFVSQRSEMCYSPESCSVDPTACQGVLKYGRWVVVREVALMLESKISSAWAPARYGVYSRVAAAVPVQESYAMPREVEDAHLAARRERVAEDLRAVLERLRKRRQGGQD